MFPNRTARPGVPAWSETKWFGCWNDTDRVGLFVHAGRMQADVDLWWVQTVAYLPDGQLAVDRSWGSTPDDWTLATSVFSLMGRADGAATSTFDGTAELAAVDALLQHPHGSGSSVRMSWQVDLELVRAPWSPFHSDDETAEWAGDAHTQQHYRAMGSLTVAGQTFSLEGPAWGDHSSGTRTWDGFGEHILVNAPLPGAGLVLIAVQSPTGDPVMSAGAVFGGAVEDPIAQINVPPLADLKGAPRAFDLIVETESGRKHEWAVEVLHTLPATITEVNDNCNGLAWDAPGDPVFLAECIARFTTPGGLVGIGHLERSARRSSVIRSTGQVDR